MVLSAFRPPLTQLNDSFRLQFPFVFRRLQSLQLLLPAHPYPLRFLRFTSLGFHFHDLSPLPLLFLTPAVFAPFRPLQFWVLTTQPLCFLSLIFPLPPHSGFHGAPPSLSLPRLSPFSHAWFPVRSIPVPVLSIAVRFFSPFPDSLPQLFLRCSPLGVFRFPSASFRPCPFRFRLLSLLLFLSVLPQFRLTAASLLAASALASPASPFSPA